MTTRTILGVALGALVVTLVLSQQLVHTAPTLTAEDYIQIEQLYTRYNFGFDTHAGQGSMWADTFTADGIFDAGLPGGPVQGHEGLTAFAKPGDEASAPTPQHFVTNIMIEPTASGAMGSTYFFRVSGDSIGSTGVYHDELVKTHDGWRFAKRQFVSGAFPESLTD